MGWGWACGDSRRAGAAGHGKRLSSFEAGSGVGAGQGSNGGVTAGTPPAGRGWLSSEPADGRWKAGSAIKYPVFGGAVSAGAHRRSAAAARASAEMGYAAAPLRSSVSI